MPASHKNNNMQLHRLNELFVSLCSVDKYSRPASYLFMVFPAKIIVEVCFFISVFYFQYFGTEDGALRVGKISNNGGLSVCVTVCLCDCLSVSVCVCLSVCGFKLTLARESCCTTELVVMRMMAVCLCLSVCLWV